jgi:hypothetical protein
MYAKINLSGDRVVDNNAKKNNLYRFKNLYKHKINIK